MSDITITFEYSQGNLDKVIEDIETKFSKINTTLDIKVGGYDDATEKIDKLTTQAKALRKEFRKMFVVDAQGGNVGQAAKNLENATKAVSKENVKLEKERNRQNEKETKRQEAQARRNQSQITSALKMAQRVDNYMNKFSTQFAASPRMREEAVNFSNALKTGKFNDLTGVEQQREFAKFVENCRTAGIEAQTLRGKIADLFSQHFSIAAVMVGVHALTNSFKTMYQNVLNMDSALTQLEIVTSSSNNTLVQYFNDASKAAQNVGKDITEVLNSATAFARLGYQEDAVGLAELTSKYAAAGGFGTDEATSGITSVLQAFDTVDTGNLETILDKMVYVGNNFPISTAELAEGIQNAGSALSAANDSVEGTIALMTAANASVQNIAKSSTALRTITARIRNSQTDLEELGETMEYTTTATYRNAVKAVSGIDILEADNKTFKSTYEILKQLSEVWNDLSDIDQASITKLFAGTRQVSIFSSIMKNFQIAEDAMREMESGAVGTLEEANTRRLNSIEGKMAQTSAKFQSFSKSLLESDFIKGTVDIGGGLIDGLQNISDTFGGLPTLISAAGAALSVFFNKGFFKLTDNFDNTSTLELTHFFKMRATRKTDLAELDTLIGRMEDFAESGIKAKKVSKDLNKGLGKLSENTRVLASANLQGTESLEEQVMALKNTRKALQQTTIASKVAAFGMRTLAMAGNMVLSMGIGILLNAAISGLSYLFNYSEERAEKATDAINTYTDSLGKIKEGKDFISDKDTINEFVKLSKGVNNLGENVSLSNEQFEKYREISNQIKDLFPDMVKGYNAQGDVILKNAKSTEEFVKQLKDANDLELRKSNTDLLESADSIIGDYADKMNYDGGLFSSDTWAYSWNLYFSADELKKEVGLTKDLVDEMIQLAEDYRAAGNEISNEDIEEVYRNFEDFGTKTSGMALDNNFAAYVRQNKQWHSDWDNNLADVLDNAGGTYNQLINYQQDLNAEIDNSTKKINDLANAYAFNENFDTLTASDEKRGLISNVISNLSSDFYDGVKDYDDLKERIDGIVNSLLALDEKGLKTYSLAVDYTTKYNDSKMSYAEWQKQIKALLELFKDDEDIQKSLRIIFDVDENGNTDSYNRAFNKLRAADGAGGTLSVDNKNLLNQILGSFTQSEIEQFLSGNFDAAIANFVNKNPNANAKQISDYIKKIMKQAADKTKSETYKFSEIMDGIKESKKALSELDKAYAELRDNNGVSSSTLSGIYDAFKNVSGIENYINKLSQAKGNTEETKKIMSELASEYVKTKIGVDNLAHANVSLVESMLEESGIANASEVANLMVAKAKLENAVNTNTLTKKTTYEVSQLLKEVGVVENVNKLFNLLKLSKMDLNKISITNDGDINNLVKLAKQAGITGEALINLSNYKKAFNNATDPRGKSAAASFFRQEMAEIDNQIDDNLGKTFDFSTNFTGDTNSKSGSGSSSSSYSATEDAWLKKRQKELDKLKHKHEMGVISEDYYYKKVAEVYKKFAPKIKSKKAEIEKLQKKIANTKGKKKKDKLTKDLEQAKKDLEAIQSKSKELSESIHNYQAESVKTKYSNKQSEFLEQYIDGEIKSLKSLKSKLKKWLKENVKTFDKDLYKELLNGLPDWLVEAQDAKFDRKNAKLDTLHDFDLLNDGDYYKQKVNLAKEFYSQDKKYKEQYIDSVKSLYDYCKEQYKKDVENQKESLEDQKQILEDRKDAIQEFYDRQIELLENADDLDKYYSEQAEKRKSVNDIRSQINRLQRDGDSAVAQKRIKELQSELKDAEDDLIEFEKDRALQETISMLQEQCNNELKAIEDQIKSIDEKMESLDKTLKSVDEINAKSYDIIRQFAIQNKLATADQLPTSNAIKGWYASGTPSSIGGMSVTQEKGAEAVGINVGSGKFTYLTPNSKVISAEASKLLYNFANNPKGVLDDLLQSSERNAKTAIQNIANNNTQNTVNVSVNVQGNTDNHLINKMSDEIAYKVLETFKKLK